MRIQVGNEIVELKPPKSLGKGLLIGGIAILLIIIGFNTFYKVETEENGVVLRFGKHVTTVGPGLYLKFPFGIDEVILVPVTRVLKQEFGYGTEDNTNPYQWISRSEMEKEKNMVTGDLNSVLVEWVIQYKIAEPENYLFNVRNADITLRAASESVMREVVGDRTVDEVITVGRNEIAMECREKLKALVELYEMGISISQVQLKTVNPPIPVQQSFNEVNRAQQEKEKSVNQANGEYNRAVPKARGDAERVISEAQGYATKRINEAEGDAAKFDALFAEYQKAPEVTRRRLYLEAMEEVMPRLEKKVIIDEGASQVLPFLPLSPGAAPGSTAK